MGTPDATAELLRSLDDPTKFEFVPGVPVFRAHEREFPEQKLAGGKVIPPQKVKVTDADLYQIAARLNASIKRTGHLMPLTVGHRKFAPDADESAQPQLVGFAKDAYRVDWVVRDGERFLAVLEDEYIMRDRAGVLRQFPYRSLEYDADGKIGEGTALLLRPPFLKMGTTCLYQASQTMPEPMPTDADDKFSPEEETHYAACVKHMASYGKNAVRYAKRYMKQYGADAAGPMNAGMPGAKEEPKPFQAEPPKKEEPKTFQGGQTVHTYADAMAEIATLRQRADAADRARAEAECRGLLDPLKPYLKFDYAREFGVLLAMPADHRGGHLKYMMDTYQTLPTGGLIQTYQGTDHLPAAQKQPAIFTEPPKYDDILAYMRTNPGMSYEDAKARVTTGQK